MKRFTILLHPEPEAGGYSVTVPALPGCFSQGDTVDEAIANAEDAIRLYLEDLEAEGEPIPEEREPPHLETVEIA
jgi:antitoxin HicB